MASETPPASLAAALAAFQAELPNVEKNRTGEVSGTSKTGKPYSYTYKYADLADVNLVVLPAIGKHGLSFTSKPTTIDGKFGLAYSLLHVSGEREDGFFELRDDPDIQRVGGRITYARRYCICAVTGVAAEEDTDARNDAQQPAKRTRGKPPERAPANLPRNADGSLSRSQITDDELHAAGVMTSGAQKEHTALRNGAVTGKPDRPAERLTAPDPDDPWANAPPPGPAIRTPNAAQGLIGIIVGQFDRLGITDRDERLTYTSRLAGRDLSSSKDMTKDEAAQVADALSRCRDIGQLQAAKEMADHG